MSAGEELTDEDVATLRKCRQLSFWRGSVPFTIGSVLMVGTAQRMGFFSKRPRLAIPSYVLATAVGYIGGKITYIGECKRMFMELNDSRIKDQIMAYSPYGYPRNSNLDDPSSSPMIVNTPTRSDSPQQQQSSGDVNQPLSSYAERRKYYRGQVPSSTPVYPEHQNQFTPAQEDQPSQPSENSRQSYFDKDRPMGSYQFDDAYQPRE